MIKVKQTILVEGKYDKIKLSSYIEGNIMISHGFSIFKDKKKIEMLRILAKKDGILILTDSDRAGFAIRGYVKGCIKEGKIYHAYIPEVLGKEKRKEKPSKQGLLGVEGIDGELILKALKTSGALSEEEPQREPTRKILQKDLYEDGLSGRDNSYMIRKKLLDSCGLPSRMSTRELVGALNSLFTYEEYKQKLEELV